jgi:hypothetical protein
MKKPITIYFLAVFLFSFCNKPSPPIQGVWKSVYQKFSNPDTTVIYTLKDFSNPQIKIIAKSYFAFGYQDSSGATYGGGKFTLNGNQYVETPLYFVNPDFINKPINWTVEIKNDTLYQSGFLDSAKTEHLLEKFIRLE